MSTGEFSIAGGYSTADGFMAEVSVGERNLLGRGQFAKASVKYGQRTRGFDLSFVEPYFLGYRMALGLDMFAQAERCDDLRLLRHANDRRQFAPRLRAAEDLVAAAALFALSAEDHAAGSVCNNCNNIDPNWSRTRCLRDRSDGMRAGARRTSAGARRLTTATPTAKPRWRCEGTGARRRSIVSLVGYTLTYNTLDNNKNPTSGIYRRVQAGFRRRRRRRELHPHHRRRAQLLRSGPGRRRRAARCKAAMSTGWGGKDLRMLDHFQMGPNLVRGFAPAGIGPRDLTPGTTQRCARRHDVLGRQRRVPDAAVLPAEGFRHQGRGLRRCRLAVELQGPDLLGTSTGETLARSPMPMTVRSSVGVGLIWDSPFGPLRFDFAYAAHQGELRPDAVLPLRRRHQVLILTALGGTVLAA